MTELDEQVLRTAARGSNPAFKQLYDHYAPFVWRLVLRTVGGDEGLAQQAAQDVFVRVHANLRKFDHKAAFSTWLYRVAYNQSLTLLARQSAQQARTTQLSDNLGRPSGEAAMEAADTVRRVLAGLSAEERFLLVAREVDGVPFEDLAAITGKTSGALRVQLTRLKDALRKEHGNGTA